jgi:hypothetical protein
MFKTGLIVGFGVGCAGILNALPGTHELLSGHIECFRDEASNSLIVKCMDKAAIKWGSFSVEPEETITFQMGSEEGSLTLFIEENEKSEIEGTIKIECEAEFFFEGELNVSGKILASGQHLALHAPRIHLYEDAKVDVSSSFQSGTLSITASDTLAIDPKALLLADCLESGAAGRIALFAGNHLNYYGFASASGRNSSASAGCIELCSLGSFIFQGKTDLSSPLGCGTLLLDPKYIVVTPSGSDPATGNSFSFLPDQTVIISDLDLSNALDTASVVLQANTDIIFYDKPQVIASTSGNGLTLQAGRSILLDNGTSISLNQGIFSATINDENAVTMERDPGSAHFQIEANTQILTNGEDILASVGNFNGTRTGDVYFQGAVLNAGGGDIVIEGIAPSDGAGSGILLSNSLIQTMDTGGITLQGDSTQLANQYLGTGVFIDNTTVEVTGPGEIQISGEAGGMNNTNVGIYIYGLAARLIAENGMMTLSGTAQEPGTFNIGTRIGTGAQIGSTMAPIHIEGSVMNGINRDFGVLLEGTYSGISSSEGDITIIGNSSGLGDSNQGILVEGSFNVTSTGIGSNAATITFQGMGDGGGNMNHGVNFESPTIQVQTVDGDIFLNGTGNGGGQNNQGVVVQDFTIFGITGNATLTINNVGSP